MAEGIQTVIYPVKDLAKAKALFRALLEVEPAVDEPNYVGFHVAGQDIGLDPHGHGRGMTGPVAYWHVNDIEDTVQTLLIAGAEEVEGVRDVGGGKLIATLKDADGNRIGLLQPVPPGQGAAADR
ncbi:VOC family protein [Streptomyces sp. NPDC005953]|uniref:VOC family protein n=1 Tax=unclassified Streptomyces TaxID=2593676 RepID=UPI0033EB210C